MITRSQRRAAEARDTQSCSHSTPELLSPKRRAVTSPTKARAPTRGGVRAILRNAAARGAACSRARLAHLDSAARRASELSTIAANAMRESRLALINTGAADDELQYRRVLEHSTPEDRALLRIIDAFDEEVEKVKAKITAMVGSSTLPVPTAMGTDLTGIIQGFTGALRPFQRDGVAFLSAAMLRNNLNPILADEMGLGKTVQTIALLMLLWQHGGCGPALIVAPLSTLPHWTEEFARFAPSVSLATLTGTAGEREVALGQALRARRGGPSARGGPQVAVLVPHDYLSRRHTQASALAVQRRIKRTSWMCVVVDEAQRVKNASCTLHQILLGLKTQYRLSLTGTPMQNNFNELFALLSFALPDVFVKHDKGLFAFLNQSLRKTTDGISQQEKEKQIILCKRVHRILEPFVLRRERKDVLQELPHKEEHAIRCPLVGPQRDALTRAAGEGITSNFFINARKILIHPFTMLEEFRIDEELVWSSGKLIALDAMLPFLISHGHQVVLFSLWTTVLDVVETLFLMRGWSYRRLDGSVGLSERQERIAAFSDKSTDVSCFLVSKMAGGVGLNLQAADTVILLDIDFNPSRDDQALSRVYRIGQSKPVKIFWLRTDSAIEQYIAEVAEGKRALELKVIHAGLFDAKSTSSDRTNRLEEVVGGSASHQRLTPNPASRAGSGGVASSVLRDLEEQLIAALPRGDDERQAVASYFASDGAIARGMKRARGSVVSAGCPEFARNRAGEGAGGPESGLSELSAC